MLALRCAFPPLGNPFLPGSPLPGQVLVQRIDFDTLTEMMRDTSRNVLLVNALGRVYSGICQIKGSYAWWCGKKPYTMAMPPATVPSATYFERWHNFPEIDLPITDTTDVVAYCAHKR